MPVAGWRGRDRDPQVVAADLARALGAELRLERPPFVRVLAGETDGVPAGSLLPARERFTGMPAPTQLFVHLDACEPRPFEVRASVLGGGAVRRAFGLGFLVYAVPLGVRVAGRVALGERRRGRASAFAGDPAAAERLNADPELLALAAALAPSAAGPDGARRWAVERLLAVEPGATLVVRTLHRPTATGWSLAAEPVLALAAMIEGALA
ncbi:hypothetical protein ACGFX4_06100 [Kitasatospora sp. NPDC048365]|uniref:hypothetical protein n=1 Tax=Kitasatospora sp. NPDC048365 TaxID=3364050 RepID=UPI00371E083F